MPAFQFTAEQRATFERDGVVRFERFFDRADIAAMAAAVWADLHERHGVVRERPETWTVERPMHFQTLKASRAFARLKTPATIALADALLGEGRWSTPTNWGQPLVTFPSPADWRPNWHFDLAGPNYPWPLPLIRLFTFLEPTAPGGGGTLYVQGVHRLAMRLAGGVIASAKLRRRMIAAHPWFAALAKAPPGAHRALQTQTCEIDGVEVGVRQMSGQPGDAILMHPLMLHSGVENAAATPRMMLVDTILARPRTAAKAAPA